jgi:hypothetical protein
MAEGGKGRKCMCATVYVPQVTLLTEATEVVLADEVLRVAVMLVRAGRGTDAVGGDVVLAHATIGVEDGLTLGRLEGIEQGIELKRIRIPRMVREDLSHDEGGRGNEVWRCQGLGFIEEWSGV